MASAIMVIFPYRYQQTWVFDNEKAGLVQEPFLEGKQDACPTKFLHDTSPTTNDNSYLP
jgi:hypothetical protein